MQTAVFKLLVEYYGAQEKGSNYLSLAGFPGGSVIKNTPANVGDSSSILGSGRSPGEGNGNSFQYSCLENPMGRGTWWAIVHGVAKSQTQFSD